MRVQLFGWLSDNAALAAIVDDRIFPVNMEDVAPTAPYIVYKLGTTTPRVVPAQNEIAQIWAHDRRGDYKRVDSILEIIKEDLKSKEPEGSFIAAVWLDDSEDFLDDVTNTIYRYTRFQLVRSES